MVKFKFRERLSALRNRQDATSSSNVPTIVPAQEINSEIVSPAPQESPAKPNDPSASKQDQSTTSALNPALVTKATPESRTSSSLWDEAIRILSEDKNKCGIIEEYKKAVLAELVERGLARPESTIHDVTNQGMQEWLRSTSAKQIAGSKGRELAGNVAKAVSSVSQVLSAAAGANPYIGLACAGLCILTVPLLNAAEQSANLVKGLDQVSLVTIRFNSIEQVLQPKPADTSETLGVQSELASRVVLLFSGIIEYQARAVYYFVHQRARLFRDLIKVDDWAGLLEQISQSEIDCSGLVKRIKEDRLESRFARRDRSDQHELLDRLPRASAAFNDNPLEHQPTCYPDTRVQLLQDIENWSSDSQGRIIFWLKGLAGTGKSTIARTVASRLHEKQRLAGSFFFARGQGDRGRAKTFFTTLAFQLSAQSDYLGYIISEAINTDRDIINKNFHEQWRHLVFKTLQEFPFYERQVVVIDALDECDSEQDVQELLKIISQVKDDKDCMLRFFITSRPEIPVKHGFDQMAYVSFHDYALHDMDSDVVNQDIKTYLKSELKEIDRKYSGIERDWPCQNELVRLAGRAGKLFIYAATASRFIDQGGPSLYEERLTEILEDDSDGSEEIDKMYTKVLQQSIPANFRAKDEKLFFKRFQRIVGTVVVLFRPLTVLALGGLLSDSGYITSHTTVGVDVIRRMLPLFGSILDIPKNEDATIQIFHLSFHDFLLSKERCTTRDFRVSKEKTHVYLANCCLSLMSAKLKENMCNLKGPGALSSELRPSQVNEYLPTHVQYACQYWVDHIKEGRDLICDDHQVHTFLKSHFLPWLESLSLIGRLRESIRMIDDLVAIVEPTKSIQLSRFLHDAKRFILSYFSIAESAPLQLYSAALIFAPKESIIRDTFQNYIPNWISQQPVVNLDWSAALQTLEGHSDWVRSVAVSHDSKLLASASDDKTVKVWDVATGSLQQTLEGHSKSVKSVAFSHDSKLLASASDDRTVKVWDAATGSLQQTLEGDSTSVNSVAFSHDSKLLASASDGKTVKVWDAATGSLQQTLEGHSNLVYSVVFSHDSKLLASASIDQTVKVWDTATGSLQQTLEGHSDWVRSVAFSHDSKLLVSASSDQTVKVWDAATGSLQQTLEGHSSSVNSVAFSHDSKLLASASVDKTVKVWDAATGSLQQTLEGHSNSVNSVAFSHDSKLLASASDDRTVKVWDAATGSLQQTVEGHSDWVRSVAFSHDSKLLASATDDKSVKVWDAATGSLQQTLEGHSDWVKSVAFSHDSKLLASASDDQTVKVWDTATSSLQQTLEGHSSRVYSVAFSHDSKLLASASGDQTIKVWDAATGSLQQTLEGHSDWVRSVAFSHDSKLLASASDDKTVKVWDAATGSLQQTLEGHSHWVKSVAFSHDSKLLASASEDQTVKVWDAATGFLQQTLEGHSDWVRSVAFSHDSKLLASASSDQTVKVWDAATGSLQQTLEGHSDGVKSVAFSHDSKLLASASDDKTVKVWDVATGSLQQTLIVNSDVRNLFFDITDLHLITSLGHIKVDRTQPPTLSKSSQDASSQSNFQGLGINRSWITWNARNLLWLPPDYRSLSCDFSLSGSTVAIGGASGKVSVIGFSLATLSTLT